jgi:hypothetical protein
MLRLERGGGGHNNWPTFYGKGAAKSSGCEPSSLSHATELVVALLLVVASVSKRTCVFPFSRTRVERLFADSHGPLLVPPLSQEVCEREIQRCVNR